DEPSSMGLAGGREAKMHGTPRSIMGNEPDRRRARRGTHPLYIDGAARDVQPEAERRAVPCGGARDRGVRSGRTTARDHSKSRTMCGVTMISRSFLVSRSEVVRKSGPMIGMFMRNG